AARSGEHDRDAAPVMSLCKRAEEVVDRGAKSALLLEFRQPEMAVDRREVSVGRDDVDAIRLERDRLDDLLDRHPHVRLENLREVALVLGRQVDHDHVRESAVRRNPGEELPQRRQPSCRRPDPDDSRGVGHVPFTRHDIQRSLTIPRATGLDRRHSTTSPREARAVPSNTYLLRSSPRVEGGQSSALAHTFRNRTGFPWSWSWIGSASSCGVYVASFRCAVPPRNGSASWTTTPLCRTVTRAFDSTTPSAPKRGRRKTMSYDCHSPGARLAFTSGGLWPYIAAACPSAYVTFSNESSTCTS